MMLLRLLQRQLDRFFPFYCQMCGEKADARVEICQSCKEGLPWILNECAQCSRPLVRAEDTFCGHCIAHPPVYQKAIVMFRYEGVVRQTIVRMKFHRSTASIRLLAGLMAEHLRHIDLESPLILPVPLHGKRMRQRGYNQSAEIAKELSSLLSWSVNLDLLAKSRHTLPQTGLSGALRRKNVKGAFEVKGNLSGQSVLLIDDVVTTDSTISECAAALLKAGAGQVFVCAVARSLN